MLLSETRLPSFGGRTNARFEVVDGLGILTIDGDATPVVLTPGQSVIFSAQWDGQTVRFSYEAAWVEK